MQELTKFYNDEYSKQLLERKIMSMCASVMKNSVSKTFIIGNISELYLTF